MACLQPSNRSTFWSNVAEPSSKTVSVRSAPAVSSWLLASVTPLRTEVQWVESLNPVPAFVNLRSAASGDGAEAKLLGVAKPPGSLADALLSSARWNFLDDEEVSGESGYVHVFSTRYF